MRKIVAGKLHGIHVTDANIDYHGSVTLDPDLCERAGILPMEFVDIWKALLRKSREGFIS